MKRKNVDSNHTVLLDYKWDLLMKCLDFMFHLRLFCASRKQVLKNINLYLQKIISDDCQALKWYISSGYYYSNEDRCLCSFKTSITFWILYCICTVGNLLKWPLSFTIWIVWYGYSRLSCAG